MKHIALALSLLVPISAQARSPVPPSQWTQNYIPSLADWKSALLYNGLPLGQALENEILRASDGEALKLNRNDDTSINQILTTPTIHGGAAMGQSLTTPTINGGIATGQVLSRPTITNGTAVGMNIGASTSTPLNASDARLVSDKFGEALSVLDFGANVMARPMIRWPSMRRLLRLQIQKPDLVAVSCITFLSLVKPVSLPEPSICRVGSGCREPVCQDQN